MRAIERRTEVRAAAGQWRRLFATGATPLAGMGGTVFWHDTLGVWGLFGKTHGRGGIVRDWNPFGQKPHRFRSNMIVEINPPPSGIDLNLQGAFGVDRKGKRWLLHQGRMSVSGSRVTERDFIEATGLTPAVVRFSDGSRAEYHKVAPLDAPAAVLQESIAAYVAECARARLAKTAPSDILSALGTAQAWERGLKPEATGSFEVGPRAAIVARRRHAEVWQALAAELERRGIRHSNDRVAQYGPDLFTYEGPRVLFEIKSGATSRDVFEGVGQLHIYERLLDLAFQKVLVVPKGMGRALAGPLKDLKIKCLEYEQRGRTVSFDVSTLSSCLKR